MGAVVVRRLMATAVLVLLCTVQSAAASQADSIMALLHAGKASEAAALATRALPEPGLAPQDRATLLVDRGLAHEMLGERDAALVDFTEGLNLSALSASEQAQALFDRGVTLDELGRTEDALGDYAAAIRLQPKFPAALNNRANAYRRLGHLAQARNDYEASIGAGNAHPEYPEFGLGQIAEVMGQRDRALVHYRAALDANPQFDPASERLAALGVPSGEAPIILRPPRLGGEEPAPDPGVVHLHPPTETPVRLRRPRTPAASEGAAPPVETFAPGLDLKPAIDEPGRPQIVQLGAWRGYNDASTAWNRLIKINAALLAGLSSQIVSVDLPGRGRFYRLRAGPVSAGKAPALCAALSARGVACMVVRD